MRNSIWVSLGVFAGLLLVGPESAVAQSVAIVGGDVHPVSGPPIPGGTVLIQDGLIRAVGANVSVPSGARIIDATGKVVTPGFLESMTQLGVVELGGEAGPRDVTSEDDRITASFNVLEGINPFATAIPVTRVAGVTRVVVAPAPGGSILAGEGVFMALEGSRVDEMVDVNPVAVFGVLGEGGSARAGGARGAAVQRLREALEDARHYSSSREAYEAGEGREYTLSRSDLEALVPVVEGTVPLVLTVHRASDILGALRLQDAVGFRLVLAGVREGWMVAQEIAAAGVPVLVDGLTNLPAFESLGNRYENAALLSAAGVELVLSSFDTNNARNLRQGAGNAVSYGLSWDDALRAVTLTPAQVWGVHERVGSLEAGKEADVVIWSADPLELTSRAEMVFIRGVEVSSQTRQRELFLRYRDLNRLPPG
ncbi:MAG: amidohydrolase family protein [Gemmatimonadota bacterium]